MLYDMIRVRQNQNSDKNLVDHGLNWRKSIGLVNNYTRAVGGDSTFDYFDAGF